MNIKRYIKNILKKEIIKKEKKSKLLIQTDLPSFDLELDKIGIYEENESIKILRKEYEIKLASKKEKEEKEKKLMNQKKLSGNDEENSLVKKTLLNPNKNIVKIKPIRLEDLISEFKDLKSQTKEVRKITDMNIDFQSKKK